MPKQGEKQKPAHEIRLGRIKATIWENETENDNKNESEDENEKEKEKDSDDDNGDEK